MSWEELALQLQFMNKMLGLLPGPANPLPMTEQHLWNLYGSTTLLLVVRIWLIHTILFRFVMIQDQE